jgi:protein subunit release factor A
MEMTDSDPRETPFPIPESDEALLAQCRVETFRSGGKGGQHQNTTDSGVRLIHEPTGTRVTSRNDRSQHRNKAIALLRLRRKLEKLNERRAPRVATKVPATERRKRLESKRKRARTKALRRAPPDDE